ncbi:MAG: hypothetical protein H0X28_00505 [Solirubrobacterales bacterium]|nr:hypothetical protein [Solirubrobacterales bacterium]
MLDEHDHGSQPLPGDSSEDWLLGFLEAFASTPEEQRDAAIDALPPEARGALLALAEARAATAATDMIEALDAGQAGLDRLYELSEPTDLLAVINLAVREQSSLVVEALFAALVLHRRWDDGQPPSMLALREQWHWHVYEQIAAAQQRAGEGGEQEA